MRWSLPVTMTARVRRPLVASTSFVLPLALSMSRFTGRESSATIATICSATTTLPCPKFTRCVTDPLPPFPRLFKVLRLFPHLLDDPLGGEGPLGELEIVRLRGDGVDLAVQLLDQEVERPADGAAALEQLRELLEVCAEARQLFPHVGLLRPDGDLGDDAPLVDGDVSEQGADPLAQALLIARERRRRARRELGRERLALRRAAYHQRVEGASEHLRQRRPRDPRRGRLGLLQTYDA